MTTPLVFGKPLGNPAQAQAQAELAASAFRFIDQGLARPDGADAGASVSVLSLTVHERILRQASGIVPTAEYMARVWREGAWDEACRDSHIALLQAFVDATPHVFGRLPAPALGIGSAQQEAKLVQGICGLPLAAPPAEELKRVRPVEFAYEMACHNKLRYEQRITLLCMLAGLARSPAQSTIEPAAAQAEHERAYERLWAQRAFSISRMFAMGTLLGGEYLERNKQFVKRTYGAMSVVELFELDARIPAHQWPVDDEECLRRAIAGS